MRPAFLFACLAVAASVGAAFAAAPTRQPTWPEVAAGLRPSLDLHSANVCQRGTPICFDIVLAELRRREHRLARACDHNALWADLYKLMIEQVRLTDRAGEFRNRPRITHFDALFARSYFEAFDHWRAGQGAVPAAWAVAFDAADRRSARGFGDLLLGLNAHISRDLAYAVADSFPDAGRAMDPDYLLISRLVEQLTPRALADISARFDSSVAVAGLPLAVSGGRKSLGALVVAWTAQAWRNGIALRDATPAARVAVARRIDGVALGRARAIAAATAYLTPLGTRKRDAYCAAQRAKGASSGGAQTRGNKADPTVLCDLSLRCTPLVSRWTRVEGLRGRAVVGAKSFYLNGCLGCHRYLGDGRTRFAAPDLTAEGRLNRGVDWQIELLRCPSCVLAGIPMPPLPFIHVRDVAIFLEASKGPRNR